MTARDYIFVAILCAIITGTLPAIVEIMISSKEPTVTGKVDNIREDQSEEVADSLIADQSEEVVDSVEWKKLTSNVVYKAESDGIVAAFSSGKGKVSRGVILDGDTQDSLEWRTRFNPYDGAILPVQKGRFWLVQTIGETPKSIKVQWLELR